MLLDTSLAQVEYSYKDINMFIFFTLKSQVGDKPQYIDKIKPYINITYGQ